MDIILTPPDSEAQVDYLKEVYIYSFPPEERRPWELICSPLAPQFTLYTIKDSCTSRPIGMMTLWHLNSCLYVEHIALDAQLRSQGYGGRVIRELLRRAQETCLPLILEAEPRDRGDNALRRLRFYARLGLHPQPFAYKQPSYAEGLPSVELHLLSTQTLSEDMFYAIRDEIYQIVYQTTAPLR